MMEKQMYYDFATSLKGNLISKVNGFIKTEVYPDIDAIIVKINFKDFAFKYAINNIADSIYTGSTDQIVDDIILRYRKTILKGFFKSNEKKEALEISF